MVQQSLTGHFYCSCHEFRHHVQIVPVDEGSDIPEIWITVGADPVGIIQRVRAAFRALFGKNQDVAEVVLLGEQARAFTAYCERLGNAARPATIEFTSSSSSTGSTATQLEIKAR